MDTTEACNIVSALNGYTLNLSTKTSTLELGNESGDLWKKCDWVTEKVPCDKYGFAEGFSTGELWHVYTGINLCYLCSIILIVVVPESKH